MKRYGAAEDLALFGRAMWEENAGLGLRAKAGQMILFQQDPSDGIYLLLEGAVRTQVGEVSKPYATGFLQGPALIGHRDLLLRIPAQESALCLTGARLLVWREAEFRAEWSASPALRAWLWHDIARAQVNTVLVAGFNGAPLEARLLRVLFDQVRQLGATTLPEHERLAALVSVSTKSVARSVAELKRRDWLRVNDRGLFEISEAAAEALDLDAMPSLFHSLSRPNGGAGEA